MIIDQDLDPKCSPSSVCQKFLSQSLHISPRFGAVILDMDGLMFNTQKCYFAAEEELCRRRGKKTTPEIASEMMGCVGTESMEVLCRRLEIDEPLESLLAERNALFEDLFRTRLEPCEGLIELLDVLERHQVLKAVATSSFRKYVDLAFEQFSLEARFPVVVTGEDVSRGKPAPDIFLQAARLLGVQPVDAIVLEDSYKGIQAAKNGGFNSALIPNELTGDESKVSADILASSLCDEQLLNFLFTIGKEN